MTSLRDHRVGPAERPNFGGKARPLLVLGFVASIIAGCVPQQPGIQKPVAWSALHGWTADRHAESWPVLRRSCQKLAGKTPGWDAVCAASQELADPDDETARRFFETHFVPHAVAGEEGRREALITGYYEPMLMGSRLPDERFRFAVYARPPSLVRVDLGSLYPELDGKTVRGRLVGETLVPFYARSDIDGPALPLAGTELLWVDDRDALFFLHVQGSGRVVLPDGELIGVGYADQNGHPYVSIGRRLVEQGELELEEVSMFSIRDWLRAHPEHAQRLLNENPSYIFFELRPVSAIGPVGAMNVPLTPWRSAAVDTSIIPMGTPLWIETTLPVGAEPEFRRLVFAQDRGGAIKGPLRADLFMGNGDSAERTAGNMKESGTIYVLLPRAASRDE